MATMDRFKDALKKGKVSADANAAPLTAQMKYDYLAAIHTMEQLTDLAEEIESRKKRRVSLREKISNGCKNSLKKISDSDEVLTLKQIDSAIKGLQECRNELFKLECVEQESAKLAKFIEDGISAGH